MSLVDLRVELPAYSQSFHVRVSPSSSVLDVKHAIFTTYPGAPRVDGQRLVWRGRILGDQERIQDICQSPDDSPVIHLAVHPSAWTTMPVDPSSSVSPNHSSSSASNHMRSTPPRLTRSAQSTPAGRYPFSPHDSAYYNRPTPDRPAVTPLPYIAMKHSNALSALTTGRIGAAMPAPDLEILKQQTKASLAQYGYAWPEVFDELWPPYRESDKGVTYQLTTIDGQQYLQLVDEYAKPSVLQAHALKVLSHTFPLLSIPYDPYSAYSLPPPTQHLGVPPHLLNAHLQQLGLPQLNVQQERGDLPEIRIIPLRALLTPMLALAFRLSFLMLFFSPFQKPIISILLGLYLIIDAALTIYNVIIREPEENEARNRAAEDGANADAGGAGGAAGNGDRQVVQQNRPRRPRAGRAGTRDSTPFSWLREQSDPIVDYLAKINLRNESQALDSRTPAPKPTIGHRVKSFFALMVLTLYPEIWNRRRTALRQREGRVKTEANARIAPPVNSAQEGSEQGEGAEEAAAQAQAARERARTEIVAAHERRAEWVKEYVERVVIGDWVDE